MGNILSYGSGKFTNIRSLTDKSEAKIFNTFIQIKSNPVNSFSKIITKIWSIININKYQYILLCKTLLRHFRYHLYQLFKFLFLFLTCCVRGCSSQSRLNKNVAYQKMSGEKRRLNSYIRGKPQLLEKVSLKKAENIFQHTSIKHLQWSKTNL